MGASSSVVDGKLTSSVETIAAACDALKDAAEDVRAAGNSILETCRKVSDVMNSLGLDGFSGGSSFGAVPMAIKAMVATSSKYVETKTGVSLRQWADFVTTARTRFESYQAQLDKIADIATRSGTPAHALDPEQLRRDKRLIEDTQVETKLWRPIMSRLPQLSQVVEAMLASKTAAAPKDDPEQKGGWGSRLKEAIDKVMKRVADEHGELLTSLLGPLADLRHRITRLHHDVEKMSTCMFELEDLLELQRAQIQVLLGEIQGCQVEILRQRITVAILIPRLKKRLTEGRQRVATCRSFLENLEAVRPRAGLSERVYSTLAAEYAAALESATSLVRGSEDEVEGWRAKGRHVLEANQRWLQEEKEAVTAREMVGQLTSDVARERLAGIGRELRRTEDAAWLVADS
jgi:hypothetical protein